MSRADDRLYEEAIRKALEAREEQVPKLVQIAPTDRGFVYALDSTGVVWIYRLSYGAMEWRRVGMPELLEEASRASS